MTEELRKAFENEDTLWGAFIVPKLVEAGLDPAQIILEKTFTLRLGRQDHKYGGFVSTDTIHRARLDLLVRRMSDSRPLCVVEFKRPGLELRSEDGEQAISYARLLPQIAPLAVVTNGETWWFFDAVEGRQLAPEELPSAAGKAPTSSPDLIAEGLRVFFALSPANIGVFCREQVNAATWPLRTERGQEPPIYSEDLYVEPPDTIEAIKTGLSSDFRVLPIVAPSGHGKSALAVHCAYEFLRECRTVFFLRARSDLHGISIAARIAEEMKYAIPTGMADDASLWRRVLSIVSGSRVLIILDGLDELDSIDDARTVLDAFATQASYQELRLLVTCKADFYREVCQDRDTLAGFVRVAAAEQPIERTDRMDRTFAMQIVERLNRKFQSLFRLGPTLERIAHRQPKLISIAFSNFIARSGTDRSGSDAASGTRDDDVPAILSVYLQRTLNRRGPPSELSLALFGKLLAQANADALDLGATFIQGDVSEADIQSLQMLVDRGVLREHFRGQARTVAFEFDLLRAHVIAFLVLRLQTLGAAELRTLADGGNSITRDAIEYYYDYSNDNIRHGLDERPFAHATAIETALRATLSVSLPSAARAFERRTLAELGVYGEFNLASNELRVIGVRSIDPGENSVALHARPIPWFMAQRNRVFVSPPGPVDNVVAKLADKLTGVLLKEHSLDERTSHLLLTERVYELASALKIVLTVADTDASDAFVRIRKRLLLRQLKRVVEHLHIEKTGARFGPNGRYLIGTTDKRDRAKFSAEAERIESEGGTPRGLLWYWRPTRAESEMERSVSELERTYGSFAPVPWFTEHRTLARELRSGRVSGATADLIRTVHLAALNAIETVAASNFPTRARPGPRLRVLILPDPEYGDAGSTTRFDVSSERNEVLLVPSGSVRFPDDYSEWPPRILVDGTEFRPGSLVNDQWFGLLEGEGMEVMGGVRSSGRSILRNQVYGALSDIAGRKWWD